MEPLLFLAHRLPYPPNKGGKVRSFQLLDHLAKRYRLFLGAFVDDPADWRYVEALEHRCEQVHVEPIGPWTRRLRAARGLLGSEALSVACFNSASMTRWTRDVVAREHIVRAFAFSSPMTQYLLDLPVRCFVDFVDMDSAKWEEYAQRRNWPASSLYRLESRRLAAFERTVADCSEASIFVSDEEAERFRREPIRHPSRVHAIRNGVDADYFSPAHGFASPFRPGERAVVFTGAMDYWPNVDAVQWFANEVLPALRQYDSAIRFHIVGRNPSAAVRRMAGDAIDVTGQVADVRPYLQHARVVVAPLRLARGVQNKILEAMAMARPVVASAVAVANLRAQPGSDLEEAPDARTFCMKVVHLMNDRAADDMGRCARARVLRDYAWSDSANALEKLLQMTPTVAGRAACV